MKKLRLFDSLKFVRAMFVVVACIFAFTSAHAATLPAGYTELEYIESTGGAYIDTGVFLSATDTSRVTLDAIFYNNGRAQQYCGANGNNTIRVNPDTRTGIANTAITFTLDERHIIETLSNVDANRSAIVDGIKAVGTGEVTNSNKYLLFSLGDITDYYVAARLYSIKINKNSEIVFNGIPARRDSDGVLGMYDLADANPATAFHTNAGTGTFIAGEYPIKIATTKYNEESFAPVKTDLSAAVNAVEYVVSNTMTQAQAIDQIATTKQTRPDEGCTAKYCLLVEDEDGTPHWYPIAGANGVAHNLPTGYTELQYIESTGTQYIDTGLKLAAQQTPFLIDIDMSFSNMSGRYLMGFSNSSPAYAGRYSNGTFEINTRYSTIKSGIDEKLNFQYGYFPELNNEIGIKVTKNGESEYLSSGRTSILAYNTNWYIFANNASGSSGTSVLKGKIYSAKAYKNNELVFNGIPAKNSSDVVGMYDMVSGTFFTNAGTDEFTAGPDM